MTTAVQTPAALAAPARTAPLSLRPPLMAVCRNPLVQLADLDLQPVSTGVALATLRPEASGPVRCMLNGAPCYPITVRQWQYHLRLGRAGRAEDAKKYLDRAIRRALVWQRLKTRPGDIVVWHVVPQDSQAVKGIIALVVAFVYLWVTGFTDYAGAFKLFAAIYALENFIFQASLDQQAQAQGGTIYSTSLTGNQAKLDQPIWRNCGVVKITPPFAAVPYTTNVASGKLDDAGRPIDSDQYYYAVFAIGVGRHDVIRSFIGKTPISSYQDVLVAQYLPPGMRPMQALCNVVNSQEVAGLELNTGELVGGYVASQPGRKVQWVEIDVACPQGLGKDGDMTVAWDVYWQEIDDVGRPISAWAPLASESRTLNTNTPQRWTNRYYLPGVAAPVDGVFVFSANAARVSIQLARTDVKDTTSGARHALQWDGLRAGLNRAAPLDADTAHFEVVMRASKQLGAQSQRDFQLIVQGYARTWSAVGGWSCELHDWDNYIPTRNPAWYLADMWVDPLWGEGRDEARVNLQGLVDFAAICDERQDRFDYTFSTSVNAMEAAQLIAGAGRARAFERLGVITLARDALVTLPRTAFSPRNTVPNSMTVTEMTPRAPSANDGIVLEYTSNITWDVLTIDCPAPGFTVRDEDDPRYDPAFPPMTRPVYLRIEGIKGAKHAERTGLYEAAKGFYRRRLVSLTTEMQGAVISFMDAIRWQPEIGGFGQSGDVAFWDAGTLVMGLTEPVQFGDTGNTWLALMRDDGTLTTPVRVLPGPTEYDVILPAAPDFELVLDDGTRERPKFFASYAAEEIARITSIDDGGKSDAEEGEEGAQLYEVNGFIDDERVHTADIHLLPGPGEIQDPVDDGALFDSGGGRLALPRLTNHYYVAGQGVSGGGVSIGVTLFNDGTASAAVVEDTGTTTYTWANEWLLVPVEIEQAELFEAMASTVVAGHAAGISGEVLDTWLGMGTTRTWLYAGAFDRELVQLRLRIRKVDTGVVQADRIITMTVNGPDLH